MRATATPPYCTAPFTALVIDPNKGVRPCCAFDGQLGNLNQQPLTDILRSGGWQTVQRQMAAGEVPEGCLSCSEREQTTGWSVRQLFADAPATRNGAWATGITDLEINSSNVCNLACTHCSSTFSSRWPSIASLLEERHIPHERALDDRVFTANPKQIVVQLDGLNLDHLEVVRFKGGEPMSNADVPAVLRHLRDRGILPRIDVAFVTNATMVNRQVLELLELPRRVDMCVSVDGVGELQTYIRRGRSEIPRIEDFICAFAALPTIEFNLNASVMVYNVFSLEKIADWWMALHRRFPGKMRQPVSFHLHVTSPELLSIGVLQDATRRALIRKYEGLTGADYSSVIRALAQPFAGARVHNEFVAYTRGLDEIFHTDVLAVVPQLASEMTAVEVSESDPLHEGLTLQQAGRPAEAVALYDRHLAAQHPQRLSRAWRIRLQRAIALAELEEWRGALNELSSLVAANPESTLATLRRVPPGTPLPVLPRGEAGSAASFVEAPSFRLVIEGLAWKALGDMQQAVARFDEALRLDEGFGLAALARDDLTAAD